MPNNTQTHLIVTGSKADVTDFIVQANGGVDADGVLNAFSFNKLVPCPVELLSVRFPVLMKTPAEIEMEIKLHGSSEATTHARLDSLKSAYGYTNWYDWSLANWGCKWSAYEVSDWEINDYSDHTTAEISYQTAWSPASAFFLTVSKMFPNLTFKHSFADEGCFFLGSEAFCNGKMVESERFDWEDSKGNELKCKLGVEYEDEDVLNEDVAIETIGFSSASQTE